MNPWFWFFCALIIILLGVLITILTDRVRTPPKGINWTVVAGILILSAISAGIGLIQKLSEVNTPAAEGLKSVAPTKPTIQDLTPLASPQPSPYTMSALGITVEGVTVWPTSGPIRVSGKITLPGSPAQPDCSARVAFEARADDGSIVTQDSRTCGAATWPEFGTVRLDNKDEVSEIHIVLFVNDTGVRRSVCARSGGCYVGESSG